MRAYRHTWEHARKRKHDARGTRQTVMNTTYLKQSLTGTSYLKQSLSAEGRAHAHAHAYIESWPRTTKLHCRFRVEGLRFTPVIES